MPDTAPAPVLFEALCTPPRSLGRQGTLLVCLFMLAGACLTSVLFIVLGAWPVLAFTGGEVLLVMLLFLAYQRWSRRSMELVVLTEGRLTIRRADHRGRREELVLDPYWARVALEERPGGVSALLLRQRKDAVEIGRLLGDDQKRDLAEALAAALRRYREPVFDNPQLRDG